MGFLPDVTAQLVKEADIHEDKDRYVVLMWDEMKVKEDLIFESIHVSLLVLLILGRLMSTLIVLNDSVTVQLKLSTGM